MSLRAPPRLIPTGAGEAILGFQWRKTGLLCSLRSLAITLDFFQHPAITNSPPRQTWPGQPLGSLASYFGSFSEGDVLREGKQKAKPARDAPAGVRRGFLAKEQRENYIFEFIFLIE